MGFLSNDRKTPTTSLYGLVLAGGESRRMGIDKSTLQYHGKGQAEHCFDLLSLYCKKAFISIRREQAALFKKRKLPQIYDAFSNIGPLSGILSAMIKYPKVAWLVLACDLPCVDKKTIEMLIKRRNSSKMATAYISAEDGLLEPLCAIYEPKSKARLLKSLDLNCKSLRYIFSDSIIQLLEQKNTIALFNVNYLAEYNHTIEFLSQGRSLVKS